MKPIAALLAQINITNNPQRRNTMVNRLTPAVLHGISQAIDVGGLRVSFFRLRTPTNGRRVLELDGYCFGRLSRTDVPRARFVDGEHHRSNAVHQRLSEGRYEYVKNIDDPQEVPDPETFVGKAYRTYISVPVLAAERVYGMLCVDATTPGSLETSHLEIIVALAAMLGAGLGA